MLSSCPSWDARSVARDRLIGPSPSKEYERCQPASGTARWRFWARRSTCQRRSMSSSTASIRLRSCACCSGESEFHTAWAAAMRSASCSSSSSRVDGLPGNMSPNCSMNCSKLGSRSLAPLALLEHLVEGVVGVAHAGHLLGAHRRQRLGRPLEEGVGHLPAQLLDQLLELLAGLGGDEVVVLQGLDPARQVARLQVEGHAALGGHVVGDLGPALVARGRRVLDQARRWRPAPRPRSRRAAPRSRPCARRDRLRPEARPGGGATARAGRADRGSAPRSPCACPSAACAAGRRRGRRRPAGRRSARPAGRRRRGR